MTDNKNGLGFDALVASIQQVHNHLAAHAGKAVNIGLTLRNWLIGYYISEYELHGHDRAKYGQNLLRDLADKLGNVSNCNRRQLYDYLDFFRAYPRIVRTVSAQFKNLLPDDLEKISEKVPTTSAQLEIPADKLVNSLSYSHFKLLVGLDNDLKRTFYEIESIRGNWSVRELKRQIATLYYERSGLSENKEKLAELSREGAETQETGLAIRDPYVFEFLGIKSREVMHESDLEDALLDKLQEFLLELGHGFCFEARQKRILIGDRYGFVDLVFYHRIIKCHLLVDLKVEDFSHENIGQLNTYVSWYKENMMGADDKPPVGLLLCTGKDQALVKYALAGMDNQMFISKYQLELPSEEVIRKFLEDNT